MEIGPYTVFQFIIGPLIPFLSLVNIKYPAVLHIDIDIPGCLDLFQTKITCAFVKEHSSFGKCSHIVFKENAGIQCQRLSACAYSSVISGQVDHSALYKTSIPSANICLGGKDPSLGRQIHITSRSACIMACNNLINGKITDNFIKLYFTGSCHSFKAGPVCYFLPQGSIRIVLSTQVKVCRITFILIDAAWVSSCIIAGDNLYPVFRSKPGRTVIRITFKSGVVMVHRFISQVRINGRINSYTGLRIQFNTAPAYISRAACLPDKPVGCNRGYTGWIQYRAFKEYTSDRVHINQTLIIPDKTDIDIPVRLYGVCKIILVRFLLFPPGMIGLLAIPCTCRLFVGSFPILSFNRPGCRRIGIVIIDRSILIKIGTCA